MLKGAAGYVHCCRKIRRAVEVFDGQGDLADARFGGIEAECAIRPRDGGSRQLPLVAWRIQLYQR